MNLVKFRKTNKKRITIIAIVLITFVTTQVKAITSDNVLYGEGNVTEALDELNENLNICFSGDADETKILSGYQAYYKGKLVMGTIPSKSSATYTPGTSNQTISAGQYLSEDQIIKGDANLKAENITCGVSIFGIKGTDGCTTFKIGDYVQMTPTSFSYSILPSLTGCISKNYCGGVTTQSINPSELNLWRVIRTSSDGTVEMVSEYVSRTRVYFYGQTGYQNFVGALNTIAAQYANSNYTVGTRHMGYNIHNPQTSNITATPSYSSCNDTSFVGSKEPIGCGDTGYETDTNLVKTAIGTLAPNKPNASTPAMSYWLASRSALVYPWGNAYFGGYYVDTSNQSSVSPSTLYENPGSSFLDGLDFPIRPIVVLRSGVSPTSGDGTSASPWVLP